MPQIANTEPIKIIDVTKKGFNYGLYISLIFGLTSTSILIWNQVKGSIVYGKVISKTYSQTSSLTYLTKLNEEKTITGQQFLLKLSLSCLRKNLHYKGVNVYLTYGKQRVKGHIYWSRRNSLTFHNEKKGVATKSYITPSENYLTFNNVLKEGETSFYYLNFIVPEMAGPVLYDKLELEFIKPNNETLTVEIFEINPAQYFYDENLMTN